MSDFVGARLCPPLLAGCRRACCPHPGSRSAAGRAELLPSRPPATPLHPLRAAAPLPAPSHSSRSSPRLSGAGREDELPGLPPYRLQTAAGGEVPGRRQAGRAARGEGHPARLKEGAELAVRRPGGANGDEWDRSLWAQSYLPATGLLPRVPVSARGQRCCAPSCWLPAAPESQLSCAIRLSPGATAKEVPPLLPPADVPGQARRARHHCKEASAPEPGCARASPQ